MVRSLIDDGAVIKIKGGFEVTEKIDSVIIPHSINDVLIARIDRLEEKTRELVKTASVIGRSFFHRILTEVVKTLEDIDKRLEFLKEIQLIRDRIRMEELEYIFKRALTQEAAYESLLVQKRKELHLIVGQAIEKVFSEKLYEFYGMLAYHYSKGEDLEKAEEYMIKAGEEALRSSASSEALSYYQEALKLYLDKHGDRADPEKLAMFEKNIALALFYKGKDAEAIEYFDRVLDRWGAGPPKNQILVTLKLLFDLLALTANLYLPSVRPKKIPDEHDNEILDLSYKKAESLVQVNIWRNLTEEIGTVRKAFRFDLRKVDNGIIYPLSACGIFDYCGLFKLGKKALDYAYNLLDKNNIKELLEYKFYDDMYKSWTGDWSGLKQYDHHLWELNAKIGEFWHVSCHITIWTAIEGARGELKKAQKLYEKLNEIAETYESDCARAWYYYARVSFYSCSNNFEDVESFTDGAISFASRMGMDLLLIEFLSFGAYTEILFRNFEKAGEYLKRAEEFILKHKLVPPMFTGFFRRANLMFDLNLLEEAIISENRSGTVEYIKRVKRDAKLALKDTQKNPFYRVGFMRLRGYNYWLLDKQKMAMKWWQKALTEADRLGARPDLARTYMEIGKRLLEEKSKYRELNGIAAKKYLEVAREMFEEMELQWDLGELDRIVSYR